MSSETWCRTSWIEARAGSPQSNSLDRSLFFPQDPSAIRGPTQTLRLQGVLEALESVIVRDLAAFLDEVSGYNRDRSPHGKPVRRRYFPQLHFCGGRTAVVHKSGCVSSPGSVDDDVVCSEKVTLGGACSASFFKVLSFQGLANVLTDEGPRPQIAHCPDAKAFAPLRVEDLEVRNSPRILCKVLQLSVRAPCCVQTLVHHGSVLWTLGSTITGLRLLIPFARAALECCCVRPREPMHLRRPSFAVIDTSAVRHECRGKPIDDRFHPENSFVELQHTAA